MATKNAGGIVAAIDARTSLDRLGWRGVPTATAVRHFQRGWNLGQPLTVDGIAGPKTTAALIVSTQRQAAKKATASANFSFAEFACKCGGKYKDCQRIIVLRELLVGLEAYRAKFAPRGLLIASGYRCPTHNAKVGGAAQSQHKYGAAADIPAVVADAKVQALQVFSGIGYTPSRLVRHVDVRHESGVNPTRGVLTRPTVWRYGA